MNNNSFVSLYFTSSKLLLLELNSSGKKAQVYAAVDLPEGVIQDHRVRDEKSLSDILKRVWQKLKIKEKSVGIVIPEFSTFTKSINLPKLERDELDEAVKWQAEEYIPLDPAGMSLDWKILSETEEGYRVLLVAVSQDLLNGYVSAVDSAGLIPLVVETPSISLVRAVGEDAKSKLIIYFSFDETLIILAKGSEVITSSVIKADALPQVLVSTVSRIIRHFDDVEVTKIVMGGMPKDNNYIPQVSSNFKVPLEKLQHKILGMSEAELQMYTIPTSLQFKQPSEPADTETVNLLPPEITKKYENVKFNLQVWGLMLIVTLVLVGCLMALFGTYLYLVQGLSRHNGLNSLSDVTYQKSKTASDQIKNVNTLADKTLKIGSVNIYPQDVLNLIYQKKSENVVILSYKLDLEKGAVSITGLAVGRSDLLDFKNKLEEGEDFQNVILPLTSFEQGENIDFSMNFVYSNFAKARGS